MVKLFSISIITLVLALASCADTPEDQSEINQLQHRYNRYAEPSPTRVAAMESILGDNFIQGFRGDEAINLLAALPDRYMIYLKDLQKKGTFSGISRGPIGSGALGLTAMRIGGFDATVPLSIKIDTAPNATWAALQHEVGHAVQGFVFQNAEDRSKNKANFDKIFALIRQSSFVRAYSKSQDMESFADLFSSFYCSPESYAFLENNLFRNEKGLFQYLKQTLDPPFFLAEEEEDEKIDEEPAPEKPKPPAIHTLVVKTDDNKFDVWAAAVTKGSTFSVCGKSGKCQTKKPVRSNGYRNFYKITEGTGLPTNLTLKLTKDGKDIAKKKLTNQMKAKQKGGATVD